MLACGYTPQSALQESDSGEFRLVKIKRLISNCRLGIHDISRTEVDHTSNLPRFNMPFELGLDIGAREYAHSSSNLKDKNFLVFDKERFRYNQFLSDISGQDISSHDGHYTTALKKVRAWLNALPENKGKPLIGPEKLIEHYHQFSFSIPSICKSLGLDEHDIGYNDYLALTSNWIELIV